MRLYILNNMIQVYKISSYKEGEEVMKNILGQVAEPIIDVKNQMGGN